MDISFYARLITRALEKEGAIELVFPRCSQKISTCLSYFTYHGSLWRDSGARLEARADLDRAAGQQS